jgi:NAD(P)-dependent dehydrogenase (short-subunit alcohol dehydrogenase family)
MSAGILDRKRVFVTGVADPRSIGFAIARSFAKAGARVAIADRNLEAAAARASELGSDVIAVAGDIASENDVAAMLDAVGERLGGLDVLVNNAGIAQPGRVPEISTADFDRMVAVNLRGTFLVSQSAARLMGKGSSIVCIASIAAQRGGGLMGGAHYAAAKAGIVGLVRGMARDLGPRGIRVNAVNPGVITTALTVGFYDEEMKRKVIEGIPLGRFGEAEEVAGACLFLASDLSSYVTGTSLDVNGGMHMS